MKIENIRAIKSTMLLGPLWFCAVILFAGAYTPGYSQSFQAVSELAAPNAPYAWLVRFGGFVPLGLVFVLFAFATKRILISKNFQTVVFILFALTGLAIIAAGIFPTDIHGRRESFSGMAHANAGIILLVLICVAPLAVAFIGSARPCLKSFKIYSIISGLILTTLFVLLPNGISPALIQLQQTILGDFFSVWYQYQGIDLRALLFVYFIWLFIFVRFFVTEASDRIN